MKCTSSLVGGVDLADQHLLYYSLIQQHATKWQKNAFKHLIEHVGSYTYLLYNHTQEEKLQLLS